MLSEPARQALVDILHNAALAEQFVADMEAFRRPAHLLYRLPPPGDHCPSCLLE